MKRMRLIIVCLFLCMPAIAPAQESASNPNTLIGSLVENVKVNPYGQVGFQWVGSNLNLPVENEPLVNWLPLQIGSLDFSIKEANFRMLTAGLNIIAYEKYSLFGAGGGFLKRPFITEGNVPVNVGQVGGGPYIEFSNTNMSSWFFQTGVGLGPCSLVSIGAISATNLAILDLCTTPSPIKPCGRIYSARCSPHSWELSPHLRMPC